jgi:hypothetical protein
LIFLLFISILLANLAYGQQTVSKGHVVLPINKANKPIPLISHIKPAKAHNVKITSPLKGEKVPVGKSLVISGISAGNHNSSAINCRVSIIVNDVKPYRPTKAAGPAAFVMVLQPLLWSYSLVIPLLSQDKTSISL